MEKLIDEHTIYFILTEGDVIMR